MTGSARNWGVASNWFGISSRRDFTNSHTQFALVFYPDKGHMLSNVSIMFPNRLEHLELPGATGPAAGLGLALPGALCGTWNRDGQIN